MRFVLELAYILLVLFFINLVNLNSNKENQKKSKE